MVDKPISDYIAAISRIQLVTGCETQQKLADFLGIRQSSIANAKKRGSIPSDWLLTLWRKKGVNPDWILTGQGAKRLRPVNYPKKVGLSTGYIKEIRPPEECSVEELIIEVVRRASKAIS